MNYHLPLSRAVGVDVRDERRRGERFRGEDSALKLQAEPHDAVA